MTDDTISSIDAIVEERAARREAPAETAPVEQAPAEAVQAEELPAAEEVPAEDTLDTVEGEEPPAEEPPAPVAEAPHYWSAEAKAQFAALPPELQAIVSEQEKGRESAVGKAQQAAAEARKAAERAAAEVAARYAEKLDPLVAQAESHHDRVVPELGMKWSEVDWTGWFQTDRVQAAQFKAQFDAEQAELAQLQGARRHTEAVQLQQLWADRDAKLPELAPDLADPVEGPRRQKALADHLISRGVPQDRLPHLTAEEMSIAYDAMRWREAQAKAQARPQPTPRTPAPAPVKPVPARQSSVPQNLIALEAKAAKTGSLDDVLAARAARRAAQQG